MNTSTALEIVNAALAELGLPEVTLVYGTAATSTGRQMGALLNRVCKELNAEFEWTESEREHTVYLESPTTTTGDLAISSKVITNIPSTAGLSNAFAVQTSTGTNQTGLLQATRIVSVDSATQVTLNQAAISTEAGVSLQFVRDTYELPTAMGRYISDTWWDRTNNWRLIGPITPQTDQFLLSGIVQTGPRRRWRQIGPGPATWRIWPPPFTAGDTPAILSFEYITLAWAFDANGAEIKTMTADTDVPIYPEHVCVLGVKAYMWMVKGFDWMPMYQTFVAAAQRAASQDGSKATLMLGSTRYRDDLLSEANIQDGNWPGPGNP